MASGPSAARDRRVGVVTGLASEAAVITAMLGDDADRALVLCAGASTERAGQRARKLVSDGAEALLSLGVAGGTAPDLDSGDLIIAQDVVTDAADRYVCDSRWRGALSAALTSVGLAFRSGQLLGSNRIRHEPREKEAIFTNCGSLAVDMESGAVGAIAAEAGLPFLAVRAIADRAQDSLPALVTTAVKPDGRPAVGRVLGALARRPGDIPGTLRLARRTELALARLRMLEAVKAPLFGRF